jgi:hypothetical protein
MATLDEINDELAVAASLLGAVAIDIRDCNFSAEERIRHVGEALGHIYDIQHAIDKVRPDLMRRNGSRSDT